MNTRVGVGQIEKRHARTYYLVTVLFKKKKKNQSTEKNKRRSPCFPGLPCCCQRPGQSRRSAPAWCGLTRPEAAEEAGKLSHPWLKIHPLLRVSATFLSSPTCWWAPRGSPNSVELRGFFFFFFLRRRLPTWPEREHHHYYHYHYYYRSEITIKTEVSK